MSMDYQQQRYSRPARTGDPEGLGAANARSSKRYVMGDPEGLGGGTKPATIPKMVPPDDFSGMTKAQMKTSTRNAAARANTGYAAQEDNFSSFPAESGASKTTPADGGLKIMQKSTYPILAYHSQIANTDLARKAKFRVELILPGSVLQVSQGNPALAKFGKHLDMMCESITMPGKTIRSVADDLRYGPKREFAQGVTFAEVGAVFQMTSPYLEKQIFLNWHDMIIDENSWHMNYYNTYIGAMKIYALDRSEQDAFAIQMYEVYPKTIVAQDYGWAQSDAYQTLQVVFTYRNWEQIKWQKFDRELWDIGGAAYMYPEINKPVQEPPNFDAGDLSGAMKQPDQVDGFEGYSGGAGAAETRAVDGFEDINQANQKGAQVDGFEGYSGGAGAVETRAVDGFEDINQANQKGAQVDGFEGYSGGAGAAETRAVDGFEDMNQANQKGAQVDGFEGYSGGRGAAETRGVDGFEDMNQATQKGATQVDGFEGYSGGAGAVETRAVDGFEDMNQATQKGATQVDGFEGYSGGRGAAETRAVDGFEDMNQANQKGAQVDGFEGYSGGRGAAETRAVDGFEDMNQANQKGATQVDGFEGYSGGAGAVETRAVDGFEDMNQATQKGAVESPGPNTGPPGRDYRTKDQYMADTDAARQKGATSTDTSGAVDRAGAFGGDPVGDANQQRASTPVANDIPPREGGVYPAGGGNIGTPITTGGIPSGGREGDVVTRPSNQINEANQKPKSEPLTGGHPGLGPDRVAEASQVASGAISPTEGTINQGQPTTSREDTRQNYVGEAQQKGAKGATNSSWDDFNAPNRNWERGNLVAAEGLIKGGQKLSSGFVEDASAQVDSFRNIASAQQKGATSTISAGAADRLDSMPADVVTQASQREANPRGLPTDIPPREGGRITAGLSQAQRAGSLLQGRQSGQTSRGAASTWKDPNKAAVTFPVTFNTMAEMSSAMQTGGGADRGPSTQAPSRGGGPEGAGEGRGPGQDRGTGRGSSGGGAGMGALTSAMGGLGGGGLGSMLGGLTGGGAGIGALMGGLKGGLSGALKGAAVGGVAGAVASTIQAKVHSGRGEALKSGSVSLASIGGVMATATNLFGGGDMAGLQAYADSLAGQGYTSAPDPGGRGAEELGTPASNSVAAANQKRATGQYPGDPQGRSAKPPAKQVTKADVQAANEGLANAFNVFGSLSGVSGSKIKQGSFLSSLFGGATTGGTTTSGVASVSEATQKGGLNQAGSQNTGKLTGYAAYAAKQKAEDEEGYVLYGVAGPSKKRIMPTTSNQSSGNEGGRQKKYYPGSKYGDSNPALAGTNYSGINAANVRRNRPLGMTPGITDYL